MPSTLLSDSRHLTALAVPLALTQLAQVALTTTDLVMMGLLGTEALAAGGLAIVLFNQLRTMGVGLVTALGNQVAAAAARGEGAGAEEDAGSRADVRDLVRAGFAVATVAGALGAVAMIACGQVLTWLGQDAAVIRHVQPLLLAMAPGLIPCLWFQVLRQYTVGMRRPQALLRITVASIGVNAALNWAFIKGAWILPELGLTGIGLATSLVYLLSFLALHLSARRDPALAGPLSLLGRACGRAVRRLLALGVPISATYGSEAGFFSVVALLVGSFGAAALAAHTAVNQLIYLVFQITVGLSHAASISVSREVARGRIPVASRISRTALLHGFAVMTAVGVLYLAVPEVMLRPFLDPDDPGEQAAIAIATQLLAVAAMLQYFDCTQNIGVGLLRGLDDTAGGFRLTLVGYWLVGLPTAWLLGHVAAQGPTGIWLGLAAGLAATAGLLLRRFTRGLGRLSPARS